MNDNPANTACTTNNTGATNKNVNSNGSVIPVKIVVNAAAPEKRQAVGGLLGAAAVIPVKIVVNAAAPNKPPTA